ncbi:MAG: hypothetical protein IPL26_04980 [Leptospiraceae bacterium]|nr:hypothetical protein [Leptospiraceae bacterium]
MEESLKESDIPMSIIDQVIKDILKNGFRIEFEYGDVGNSNFFDVKLKGGTIFIKLNINHPAYPHLIEVLDKEVGEKIPKCLEKDYLRQETD